MRGMACLTVQNGMFHVKQSCGSESVAGHLFVQDALDKECTNVQLIVCQDVMLTPDKHRGLKHIGSKGVKTIVFIFLGVQEFRSTDNSLDIFWS